MMGVYIGGGYAVEERGFSYGCVKTRVRIAAGRTGTSCRLSTTAQPAT